MLEVLSKYDETIQISNLVSVETTSLSTHILSRNFDTHLSTHFVSRNHFFIKCFFECFNLKMRVKKLELWTMKLLKWVYIPLNVWLCVFIKSHMRFRVNPYFVVAWLSWSSLLKTFKISDIFSEPSWLSGVMV